MKKTVFLLLLPFATAALADSVSTSAKPTKEKEELCPATMLNDIETVDYECLGIFDMNFDSKVNKKYQQLLERAAKKDPALHGLPPAYFKEIRKKWQAYKDVLCDDPTVTTDLKTPADWYMYKCSIEQSQYHLKALDRF